MGNLWDDLKKSFVETVKDVSTIDVLTLEANEKTGDIDLTTAASGTEEGSRLRAQTFFDNISVEQSPLKLKLIAHTHIDIDMDAVFIINPEADEKFLKTHNAAVESAKESREKVINFIRDTLSSWP